MSHKFVSNKAVLKNESFLSKLSSTLMGRVAPSDIIENKTTSLTWHKTSDVKERIKTATGTIAVYADTPEEEIQRIRDSIKNVPSLGESETVSLTVSSAIEEATMVAAKSMGDLDNQSSAMYVAIEYYVPDDEDEDALPLVAGQKLLLLESGSPYKKAKLENLPMEGHELLDNSAAKYKMSIRPKKHHPDPRSRGHDTTEVSQERWLVRDIVSGNEGRVPANFIEPAPAAAAFATSIKRSLQEMSADETREIKRKLTKEMKEIKYTKSRKSTGKSLGPSPEDEARAKRVATIRELIETEEEFVKDLEYVMKNYHVVFDDPATPRFIADQRQVLFCNFNYIAEFHKSVLLEGVKFNADVPKLIGKTFLRLERDFDMHSEYCCNENMADELLQDNPDIVDFFEEYSTKIGDEKRLIEHLKLPIQRLNDYQLLLKELIKYSVRLGDDATELERAYELMQTIPQRATDAKFIKSIEGFKGNLFKLGRLIRHDWFTVTEAGHKPRDRYLFLFKARILVTKVKRIGEDRSVFLLKDIIRLPETSLKELDQTKVLEFSHIEPQNHPNFPICIEARTSEIRNVWLTDVQEHVVDTASVEDLLFDDEIRVVSQEGEEEELCLPNSDVQDILDELPDDPVPETDQTVPDIASFKDPFSYSDNQEEQQVPALPSEFVDTHADKNSQSPDKELESLTEKVNLERLIEEENFDVDSPEDIEQESLTEKVTLKRSKEEESCDVDTPEDLSPPLKKRASLKVEQEDVNSSFDLEEQLQSKVEGVIEIKKDLILEQLETTAHIAVEQITEPKEELQFEETLLTQSNKQESVEEKEETHTSKISPDHIEEEEDTKPIIGKPSEDSLLEYKSIDINEITESNTSFSKLAKTSESKEAKVAVNEVVPEVRLEEQHIKSEIRNPVTETFTTQVVPQEPAITDISESLKKETEGIEIPKSKSKTEEITRNIQEPRKTESPSKMSRPASSKAPKPVESGTRPVFTQSLTGQVVEPGYSATFVCEVSHDSAYAVTWFKDNKPMDDKLADRITKSQDGDIHSLKLLHCRIEDSGVYTSKATDEKGSSATCSAQLLVHQLSAEEREARILEKKPFFLVKMLNTEVIENTNLSYAIHVKGDPMPTVSFFKDGKPLVENERTKLHRDLDNGKYELTISHVQHSDAGLYKCTAENDFGLSDCDAKMSVTDEQQALENLSGKGSLLGAGETADFKWFRDGVAFDPIDRFNVLFKDEEDSLALVFQNVTPDDAGIYTCVASTTCGKISCSAELTVEGSINRMKKDPEPPRFQEELSDTYASITGTAMFECRVTGYPQPELKWTQDGAYFKIGGRIKQLWEDEENVTLIIKNVTANDKGIYKVKATNDLGEDATSCKLIIRCPPKFLEMKKEVGCQLSQSLTYTIEVDGEPLPEVKWLKDGRELQQNDNIKFDTDNQGRFSMTFKIMSNEDCGTYTVMATNDMGQRSEQFEIYADTAPEITRGMDPESEKKYRNDHTFEVRATGSPIPKATWFKNGVEIEDSDKFSMSCDGNFYMLRIKNLSRKDRGIFKIVLTNKSGSATSEGSLLVRGPPDFVNPLQDACAKEGAKDIKMLVEWDANPRPTVKWVFKDKIIHEDSDGYDIRNTDIGSMLIIHNATEDAVGFYTVTASNEYGDESCRAQFRLHELPQLLEGLEDVEYLEDTECSFTLKVSGIPIPDLNWTKNGVKWKPEGERVLNRKEGEQIYKLVLKKAQTEDSGMYSATLSNVEGEVETQGTILVNTPPHILSYNFKEELTFIAMHKLVLEVEATAVPEAEVTWFCQGNELNEETDSVKFSFDGRIYSMERLGSDPDQSGEYKCVLKNKIKEVSVSGTITIIEKESRVRQPLKSTYVKEYTDGKIQCQIVGDPIPTVQWYRNDKLIETCDRIEITADLEKRMHYLVLKNIDESDKSTFKLVGKNEHGTCETSCVMAVLVAPRPGELQDAVVDYAKDLILTLAIHAIPPPTMTWFLNGNKVDEDDRITYLRDEENEIYTLSVKCVVLEDDGVYTFTASNEAGEASGKSVVHIHSEVPSIVTELDSAHKCLEDKVTFQIRGAGLPLPEIEWLSGNKIVNDHERYTMGRPEEDLYNIVIKDIQMEDYGKITAIAKNLVGQAISTCQLTQEKLVCEILEFLPTVTKAGEGEDVTLKVAIRGSPRPTYVWTRDGDVLENGDKIKIEFKKTNYCEGIMSITILDSVALDSGQFRLKFNNELNECQTETALLVRPCRCRPKISRKPGDISVCEMQPGLFQVKVSGFPKPEVKWLKDGRELLQTDILNVGYTADNCYFVQFKHIIMEDAGRYTVIATNDVGKDQYVMKLNVEPSPSRPEILSGLKATKVIVGYPCRLEVQCGGHPAPKIQWLKNGIPLEIDGIHIKEIFTEDLRCILQIDNATDDDQGQYSVVATNDHGQNKSSADLTVLDHERTDGQPDGPASFTDGLKNGCFDEGKTIRLPVKLSGGPVPNVKWFKDGEEIILGDRCFYTHDGDKTFLEIYPCEGADAGIYKCVIENENGNAETECEVSVRKCFETPTFTYAFPNQQKVPGSEAKFCIKVDGVPKPEVCWIFNGKPIVPDGVKYRVKKEADGCTLYVTDLTDADGGTYKCVADNREGGASHQAELLVSDLVDESIKSEPPVILKSIGDQELYEDFTARFKALVTGRPIPEFEWFRNGQRLYQCDRISIERDFEGILRLTIKHVCQSDVGIYELKVWNDFGKASCKGKLICECLSKHKKRPVYDEYKGFNRVRESGVPIPIPEKPIISALSDKRCTISWMPYLPSNPMPPVTYLVEFCECPEGDWVSAGSGILGCSFDIADLGPKTDYKFRVRVENKYGVSEPSPYVGTHRRKLERDVICYEPKYSNPIDIPLDGPYVPPGFLVNEDSEGNFYAAPRFLKLNNDTQYGTKLFNGRIKWIAFGYPTPKVKIFFRDVEIMFGSKSNKKYTMKYETSGEITLFIDKATEDDCGSYKCFVSNEYGESKQKINFELCEYPTVIEHLQPVHMRAQTSGQIFCRIKAYPPCDVKWFKDWEEIRPTTKLKPQFFAPDMYCLNFYGQSMRDSGLYSLAASNVAGSVSSTCMVHVEDDESTFNWSGYGRGKQITINAKRGTVEDHYDIGDELGRGTQGVVYHCVERYTGRNFAAKSMWGKDQFKAWMHVEYSMMNLIHTSRRIVRLYDAYEGYKNMVLVMELCAGGDLLSALTKQKHITEYDIAFYIRQIVEGLDYMHGRCFAHLGLNLGDIMLTHVGGKYIRIGDLSLSRSVRECRLTPMEYGMPEYVAPEIAKGENVSYSADMWALGIITYILLTGVSPFRGDNDRETLTRIQKGELRFDADAFANLSEQSKDFVAKLLQFKPQNRMNVNEALLHPWMKFGDLPPRDPYLINTDRLRLYQIKFKDWYANASCKRWFRRRPLASAFTHPSKMVYPPGEAYTPPDSPERELVPALPVDYSIPYRDLSYELDPITNDSRYQQGPDTYLLQLRDTEFPTRLRSYMNIARERSPSFARNYTNNCYDYQVVDDEVKKPRKPKIRTEFKPTQFIVREKQEDARSSMYTINYRESKTTLEKAKRREDMELMYQQESDNNYSTNYTYESYR